jgi:hypothetical protein
LIKKTKNIICVCVCVIVAFFFLSGISYSEEKKGVEKREKAPAPEFKYDENAKNYMLDTPYFLAEFMPSSFTYTPKEKTGNGKPITFLLNGFSQEEKQIGMPEATTRLAKDNTILIFDRKDYRELYESHKRGFMQIYIIEDLPCKDKDLVMKATLSTEYSLVPNGDEGFFIKDGDKTISVFRQRAAVDSESARVPLKTSLQKNILEITVPSDYISQAKFPITITTR